MPPPLFDGEAGTYEVEGNEITFKRIVTKNPALMRDGIFLVVTFRIRNHCGYSAVIETLAERMASSTRPISGVASSLEPQL